MSDRFRMTTPKMALGQSRSESPNELRAHRDSGQQGRAETLSVDNTTEVLKSLDKLKELYDPFKTQIHALTEKVDGEFYFIVYWPRMVEYI